MINLLCAFHPYDHLIRLIQEFFLDLARKQEVFQSWNGCSFLQYPQWTLMVDFKVSSDISGALGYGAVFQGHRFSGAWFAKHLNRSLSPSSTRTSSLLSWQPSSGAPLWAFKWVNFLSHPFSGRNSAIWHFKSPCRHVPGSLSVLIDSYTFLLFTETPVRGKSSPVVDFLSHF